MLKVWKHLSLCNHEYKTILLWYGHLNEGTIHALINFPIFVWPHTSKSKSNKFLSYIHASHLGIHFYFVSQIDKICRFYAFHQLWTFEDLFQVLESTYVPILLIHLANTFVPNIYISHKVAPYENNVAFTSYILRVNIMSTLFPTQSNNHSFYDLPQNSHLH